MEPDPELEPSAAVLLAHALVASVSEARGIRMIVIKGPVSDLHGLRVPRVAADADVLVEASGQYPLLDALAHVGWEPLLVPDVYQVLLDHSITLTHPFWPCQIDVHWEYPGLLVGPERAFEVLWQRRDTLAIAGRDVPIADLESSFLIMALHALRTPSQTSRHAEEFDFLVSDVAPSMEASRRAAVVQLARCLGAVDTARPALETLGVDLPAPVRYGVDGALDAWRFRVAASGSGTSQWIAAWKLGRLRPGFGSLWRVLWPSEGTIRAAHPEIADGFRALTRARVARIGGAVRALRGMYNGVMMSRRGITDVRVLGKSR